MYGFNQAVFKVEWERWERRSHGSQNSLLAFPLRSQCVPTAHDSLLTQTTLTTGWSDRLLSTPYLVPMKTI